MKIILTKEFHFDAFISDIDLLTLPFFYVSRSIFLSEAETGSQYVLKLY